MNKKQLIALADFIRVNPGAFPPATVEKLADFCARENPLFKRGRWLDYIAGRCGPNGGAR